MEYLKDSFSVPMQGKKYSEGWERIFKKSKEKVPEGDSDEPLENSDEQDKKEGT